jgi:histidinol phosphatase-like enzyme
METQSPKTIFCDIDGTLIHHYGDIVLNYSEPPILLNDVAENIKVWEKANYRIILTTGRKECIRKITEDQLLSLGIVYDQLIMGLPNGDRILINYRKPNSQRDTCYAINLDRNKGFVGTLFIKETI